MVQQLCQAQDAQAVELQRLNQENQELRNEAGQQANMPGLVQQLGAAIEALTVALAAGLQRDHGREQGVRSLIDIKGLGKPPTFRNDEAKFTEWLRKTTGVRRGGVRRAVQGCVGVGGRAGAAHQQVAPRRDLRDGRPVARGAAGADGGGVLAVGARRWSWPWSRSATTTCSSLGSSERRSAPDHLAPDPGPGPLEHGRAPLHVGELGGAHPP
eukprot:10945282-Heterocapsa_arctica.AAC.1